LCCVAPAYSVSADFAIDKPAGTACVNLDSDFRCGIHNDLRTRGFPGCVAYDCFGAGQRVAQETFGGRDWRSVPRSAKQMFAVFSVMRQLHELLWYVTEALALPAARELHGDLGRAYDEAERRTHLPPAALGTLDAEPLWREVNELLVRASELARVGARPAPADAPRPGARRADRPRVGRPRTGGPATDHTGAGRPGTHHTGAGRPGTGHTGADHRGAELIGADLRGADFRGANLRGAYLIGADLRNADLRVADLIGADLRAADLRGADLTDCLFLTQAQLAAARGDAATTLPSARTHPAHWLSTSTSTSASVADARPGGSTSARSRRDSTRRR
jgi:hypothetical protein